MNIGKLKSKQFINQYLFFENYQEDSLTKIRNDLKFYFENIDQEIFLSSWRKSRGYIPDGFKSRTIITIYGPITFKRRVYKYWNKTKYHYVFLADKNLQIEKYSRVTSHLKFKILEQIATGKRQRDICDMFAFVSLTRATISNIINSFNFQNSFEELAKNIVRIKIPKYLYVNMDETFIRLRKNNKMQKYRIRLVTFHTGYNQNLSTEKRKVLDNKRVYFKILPISMKINTAKFMNVLKEFARKFYFNIDDIKVIIGGDGAPWIREAYNYWSNATYVLDKFHAVRYLKQICFDSKTQIYQKNKKTFEMGKSSELINQLRQLIVKSEKEQKLVKIINYFAKNILGIENQSLEENIGVNVEGDISHVVKWLLGYGSKAFNYQSFENMLFLKVTEINQLNFISFFKKQYQLETKMIKDFYWKSY
ncbi:MAG: Mbov_0401 family ICE element transposase-like protein [Spiroplasma sp.]